MNYKKACDILNIKNVPITLAELKRQYRINALLYHPDKNLSSDTTQKFQEIKEAYEYILKYDGYSDDDTDGDYDLDSDEPTMNSESSGYAKLLSSFIKNIVRGEPNNHLFYTILKRISGVCESSAIDTLQKLDTQTLIKIYEIIKIYSKSMHFGEGFLQKIETMITNKVNEQECIILNPTLDDLFENNLYRLTVSNHTYIVPLWHNELVYDNSGNDIYVKCNPILPENIEIDDANNIKINVSYNIKDIWNTEKLYINIGTKCTLPLTTSTLKLTQNQNIIIADAGISRINVKDVYDITKKSNVHINMTLCI
jgi:hypothetical protein